MRATRAPSIAARTPAIMTFRYLSPHLAWRRPRLGMSFARVRLRSKTWPNMPYRTERLRPIVLLRDTDIAQEDIMGINRISREEEMLACLARLTRIRIEMSLCEPIFELPRVDTPDLCDPRGPDATLARATSPAQMEALPPSPTLIVGASTATSRLWNSPIGTR